MALGIASGYTGLANSRTEADQKIEGYKESLSAVEKAIMIGKEITGTGDQLYNDLAYLRAADATYLWLVKDVDGREKQMFNRAVDEFTSFLKLPGAVPQWADYHLACLFTEGARRFTDESSEFYLSHAQEFIRDGLDNVRKLQNEKFAIQHLQMRCRLLDPSYCQTNSISDPIVCPAVAALVKGNPEILNLAKQL
jgi:hypothetical protein